MDRRTMIGSMSALGIGALLGGCGRDEAISVSTKPFFERIGKPIGLQLYALGPEAGEDLAATFALVKQMGYGEVELPSLYDRTPQEIRQISDSAGLPVTSLHVRAAPMQPGQGLTFGDDPSAVADAADALGISNVVIPIPVLPEGFAPAEGEDFAAAMSRAFSAVGAEHWQAMAARFNTIGAALKERGLALGYHNHNLEFAPVGDTTPWDILVAETDPGLVKFQLDLGWVAQAGRDPATMLESLSGRILSTHVKDVAADSGQSFYFGMSPTEVGSGTIDWTKVLPAAEAAGCSHYYVEQEPPFSMPRPEAMAKSLAYLSSVQA